MLSIKMKKKISKIKFSALNCTRVEMGQVMCSDCPECPECDLSFLHVEQLDKLYTEAVVVQNVVNQLPSKDKVKILTELYGAFEMAHLDQSTFHDRNGKFLYFS